MNDKPKRSRWLLHTVVFTAIFAVLFVHLSYIMRRSGDISALNVQDFTHETVAVDVVLIGGSSTFVYWMPMQAYGDCGFTSYNYADNSMSPALVKNLLIESRKTQTAKLYMIDLRALEIMQHDPTFYSEEYLRGYIDTIPYSLNRLDMIRNAYARSEVTPKNQASVYLDLIYYHGNWRELDEYAIRYSGLPPNNGKKGFKFYDVPPVPVALKDYSVVAEREPLTPKVEETMRDLLDYCKAEGLDVLFFINPFSEQDENVQMLYNSLEDMVSAYGYPFLDTNNASTYAAMALDANTDFYNVNHVNVLGAQKYTAWMERYLTEHYDLPDHRGDAAYAAWDEDWTAFCQKRDTFVANYRTTYGVPEEETP